MSIVKELNESNFKHETQQHSVAIVDYFASWCGSCRLFGPTFVKIAKENPNLPFFKVDGDLHPNTRDGLEIDNLPFVALFAHGEPVGGMNITSEESLREFVKKITDKLGSEK